MKTILNKIARLVAMAVAKLPGSRIRVGSAGEPAAVRQEADEEVYNNIFLQLKDFPAHAVKTKDVVLLRKRQKRYEQARKKGGAEAARAFKLLIRQWKRVMRNKTDLIEKESRRLNEMPSEQKIFPVSGSTKSALGEPGFSTAAH